MGETFNLMVYGDSGVGKTTLLASASAVPEMQPVLLIDVEGGTLSIRKRYPQVDTVRVKSFNDFNGLAISLRTKPHPYKTIIIDSLTEVQKLGMLEIMKRTIEKDQERDPDLPGIGEWGKNIEQTRKLVRFFRDLPYNILFTALANHNQDPNGKKHTTPSLSGKLAAEVAGFLDVVVYMYKAQDRKTKVTTRMLLTEGTEQFVAKDRTDTLPTLVEEPTMQMLHDICFNI
jgi:hypothetical protein